MIRLCAGILFVIFCCSCAATRKPVAVKATRSDSLYEAKIVTATQVLVAEPKPAGNADSALRPPAFHGTPNFGLRKPSFVILHHTAQNSCETTLNTFADTARGVSAHYVICRDGMVHHILNDYLRAWHAGASKWGNATDINSLSIGIELDNNGSEIFADSQVNALLSVLRALKDSFAIPQANFIGHADIAPTRKTDPSVLFPWKMLSESGYGNWWGDTTNLNIPAGFNPAYALRIIGYDVANYSAAVQAFRRHYITAESMADLSLPERKVLYSLMLKFL